MVCLREICKLLWAEAAKQGPEALKIAKSKRDSGFQIFYVFINVGGLIAPFIAPLLREWWLGANGMAYNAQLPALCHEFINNGTQMSQAALDNLNALMTAAGGNVAELFKFLTRVFTIRL